MGVELFHADRRTDMTRLIVAFRNFANANKNSYFACSYVDMKLNSHRKESWGEYFEVRERTQQKRGGNYIMKTFIIRNIH